MEPLSIDDDLVGVDDRPDALRDDDHGRSAQLAVERRPEAGVGREVERAEAVVEDIDGGVLDDRPGDRQPLPLAADTFVPPWAISASRPPAISLTNCLPWAISSARHSSSSVASALPKRRLLPTVPEKRNAFWGISPICCQRSSRFIALMSTPSTSTVPLVAS
jgi:hypothetical protein